MIGSGAPLTLSWAFAKDPQIIKTTTVKTDEYVVRNFIARSSRAFVQPELEKECLRHRRSRHFTASGICDFVTFGSEIHKYGGRLEKTHLLPVGNQ
jgi:hypothetical protein